MLYLSRGKQSDWVRAFILSVSTKQCCKTSETDQKKDPALQDKVWPTCYVQHHSTTFPNLDIYFLCIHKCLLLLKQSSTLSFTAILVTVQLLARPKVKWFCLECAVYIYIIPHNYDTVVGAPYEVLGSRIEAPGRQQVEGESPSSSSLVLSSMSFVYCFVTSICSMLSEYT